LINKIPLGEKAKEALSNFANAQIKGPGGVM
jgi:hypothetical protein